MLGQLVILLLILVILVGGAYFLFGRRKEGSLGRNASDGKRLPSGRPSRNGAPEMREVTLRNLEPGDAVILWDGTDGLVDTILICEEHVGERTSRWQWVFLSGEKLLEVMSHQNALYSTSRTLYQGSREFAELTADVGQVGALKTFEARVRAGTIASNPVYFELDGTRFRLLSTGTLVAGTRGNVLHSEVWCDIGDNETDNVYFKMQQEDGESLALGIWTSHIAFLSGKRLLDSEIKGLYAGQEGGTT